MPERQSPDPRLLMNQLLALAGVPASASAEVVFSGPSTVLASSFPVTAGAQALVGAFSSAVAHLATVRSAQTGSAKNGPPRIEVDSLEACVAFQSERHLRLQEVPKLWDELSGHYATADGFIQFHTNFAHHRIALLEATGCGLDGDRAAVETAVAGRGRFELEKRVNEAGGIAAALRTLDEWNQHPHASHVAGRPPLILTPLGATGDRPLPALDRSNRSRPLAGIRVLDMTRVIAGPVCSRALGAYGADVLRIGAPGLPVVDSILPDTTLGKRFAHCDITTGAGRRTVLGLAAEADVVVSGFRPGALAGYGLDDADLLEVNPSLVLGSLSAFGTDGPWGGRRGFDSITQTATGIVATETKAFDSPTPRPLPCQFLDHGTGYLLALGIVAALADRHRGLGVRSVHTSLLSTRNWLEALRADRPAEGQSYSEADRPAPVDPIRHAEPIQDSDIERFRQTRQSAFGQVRHIGQPGRIEGMPAAWDRGPSKPGADQAVWLPTTGR